MEAPAADSDRTLAVLGGLAAFPNGLHVGRPNLPDLEHFRALLDEILDRRWLTNRGPVVEAFERALANYVETPNAVALTNATVGLELVARALGLSGEVILPSFTFVATAHAMRWAGLTPVFADIDPETHCLSPDAVEAKITPRTCAILGVHTWGETCDVDALQLVAQRNGLALIFDAAHALGCTYQGRPVGGFGDAEVFSFHATKFVNSFEGGGVTSGNAQLIDEVRRMSNFGFDGIDRVDRLGTNAKMTEVCAAMGLANLGRATWLAQENERRWRWYQACFADLPGVTPFRLTESEARNFQYAVFLVNPEECPLDRDQVVNVLWAEGCFARRYFYPGVDRFEPYASERPVFDDLPVTRSIAAQVLVLPTGLATSETDIARIADTIRRAFTLRAEVRTALEVDG